MSVFLAALRDQLAAIRERGLYRELRRVDTPQSAHIRVAGQSLLNFASNDYLGLANEPALQEAARQAIADYGAGAGASRLICGSLAPLHFLEEAIAHFKGTEAALVFSSGYAAALGTIGALLEKEDIIILDKLVHASIVDAARLCGAKPRVFAHNNLNELEDLLKWSDQRIRETANPSSRRRPRVLVVTESVFSMDGDQAPLAALVALKEKYGAWLMLDEAHATGLYGANRRGLAEARGVADRVEVQLGTLGKALGAGGGYICGPRELIDVLINRARSFIFSTALTPAVAAAAKAGIEYVQSSEGEARRTRLWERVEQLRHGLAGGSWPLPAVSGAILPLITGEESRAVWLAGKLRNEGIFIPAIRYPTVARGSARLRLTLTAAHTESDVNQLLTVLAETSLEPPN